MSASSPTTSSSSSSSSSTCALSEIPLEPEQISREWLFEVINQFRRVRGLTTLSDPDDILDCSIDECDRSHGYLSTTYRLLANFRCGGDLPGDGSSSYAFFLKMMPGVEPKQLKLVKDTKVFVREVEAQNSVLPAMRLFVEEHDSWSGRRSSSSSSDRRLWTAVPPAPPPVFAGRDERDGGIVVQMDVTERGFHALSHGGGLNLAQLLAVAEVLAEFHAVGAAMIIEGRRELALDVGDDDVEVLKATSRPAYKDLARFLRKVPGYNAGYRTVEKNLDKLVDLGVKCDKRPSRIPLNTVLHGQLWEKNILLRFEPITEELDVILCDWKSVRLGCPAADLAFLVLACTSQSVRCKGIKQVLEKYFFTFSETLRKFDICLSQRFPKFTFEDFQQDFEEALLGAFLQVSLVMIREVRYLEAEFYNATENQEIEAFGSQLRSLGRRLLELCECFVPEIAAELTEESDDEGEGEEEEEKEPKVVAKSKAPQTAAASVVMAAKTRKVRG